MLTIIEDVMIVVGHDADVISFFRAMMCDEICREMFMISNLFLILHG